MASWAGGSAFRTPANLLFRLRCGTWSFRFLLDKTPWIRLRSWPEIQRKLHLFGRYGITMFAISGADIALWDLKAKSWGVPLARLLGPPRRETVLSYASLVRYGRPDLVEHFAAKAVDEGYRSIKLHEATIDAIHAGR